MLLTATVGAQPAGGNGPGQGNEASLDSGEHWTPARRAAAIPRDLVIDQRGLGYLKSVDFIIEYPNESTGTFRATHLGSGLYGVNFTGFSDGAWNWQVAAKDGAKKDGNRSTTDLVSFTVLVGGETPPATARRRDHGLRMVRRSRPDSCGPHLFRDARRQE
jgi:hypothetical protein